MKKSFEDLLSESVWVLTEAYDALSSDTACTCGCLMSTEQANLTGEVDEGKRYHALATKIKGSGELNPDDCAIVLDACRVAAFDRLIIATYQTEEKVDAERVALICAKLALCVREYRRSSSTANVS